MNHKTQALLATILILTVLVISGCSSGSDTQVTGTIILPAGATVPDGATIKVQVQDTSLADAAATTIGEQTIDGDGQDSPIEFAVAYDPDEIVDNHTYSMNVRIEDADGSLLFINDTHIPVITNGNPTSDVEVPVIEV
jgi:putative lipoprotein